MDEISSDDMIVAAVAGQPEAIDRLLALYSDRLLRLIASRLDRRVAARVGVDDILQEVHVAACRQLPKYLRQAETPFYVWLRAIAINKLLEVHRNHLGTQMRDARRETPHSTRSADVSSRITFEQFVDSGTSPSRELLRDELKSRLNFCIQQLPAGDQEVLALRHFEQLSPIETAHVLQLTEKAAGMRYTRALRRLKTVMDAVSQGSSAWTIDTNC